MADVAALHTSAPPAGAPAGIEIPDFQIVPRKGLILVAIVFAGLIVAIAVNELWPLEFLHVAFGGAWTVLDLFLGFVLGPIMGSMPPAARVAFTTRLMPKMLLIMPTVVTVALAAGWQLGVFLGTVSSDHPNHDWTVASFIVVGVMAIIALGLLEPANVAVLVELKKRRPDPAVIERLMKRFIYSAGVIGVMQIATLVIMTKLASG
jgi:MFS family permease